jgi:ABC-type branched-subunit amino acid transport system substrate-binding protein
MGFGIVRAPFWVMVALALASVACGGNNSSTSGGTKAPFQLAWIGDLTGPTATTGVGLINGFKTYIDYTNSQGGANGHKIVYSTFNDEADSNKGRVGLQSAQAASALGIFGGTTSLVWTPLAPQAAQTKILQFTLGSSDNLIDPAQPYIYNSTLAQKDVVTCQVQLIQDMIKKGQLPSQPTVSIIRYVSPSTQDLATAAKAEMGKLGWKLGTEVTFPLGATDVSAQASQIAQSKPDVLLTALFDPHVPLVVQTLRAKGYSKAIVNFSGGGNESTFQATNDPIYFSVRPFVLPGDPSAPGAIEMLKRAQSTKNTDGLGTIFFSSGYVQAILAVEALKKCGDGCDSVKFNTAMENLGKVDAKGINGDVQLTPSRHRAPGSGIFFKWDQSKGKAVVEGNWIQVAK